MISNKYIFFKYNNKKLTDANENFSHYKEEIFSPTIGMLKKHTAKKIMYIFWFIFTLGRYKIIYIYDNTKIIHYSHILPKFFKFPFMKRNDLEIGPAWTDKNYRGRGIFPYVLWEIIHKFQKDKRDFYVFTHIDNISSQRAIVKAGFYEWKKGYKSDKLGIYRISDEN